MNRIILLAITIVDEIMNDCGDGKVLVDVAQLFMEKKTVTKVLIAMLVNSLYTLPLILVWGVIGIAGDLVLCFWLGGFGLGQVLNAVVNGAGWPWD